MRLRPLSAIVTVLLFWALIAIGAAGFWPVYRDPSYVVAAVGAVLLGTAIAVLGAVFHWRAWALMLATFIAFIATGVPLAVPSQTTRGVVPTLDGLTALVSGVALGWRQLLTITLPVGDYQALLVPAFVSLLVATVIGLSIGLRARHGELGAIPAAAVLVVGIAFGPERAAFGGALAGGTLAVALLWCVWRRAARRREAVRRLLGSSAAASERSIGGRSLAAAVAILLIAGAGAGAAAVQIAPGVPRTVLRTAVVQPFDPRDYASPLAAFRGYLKDGADEQTMLRVSGLADGQRIRIATLDAYDGVVYRSGTGNADGGSGSFVRVPTSIDRSNERGQSVSVDIQVVDYRGVWLPTVGDLTSVDFSGSDAQQLRGRFYFDRVSGTGAVLGGLGADDSYRLDAVEPITPTSSQLAAATPGSARVPAPVSVPDAVGTRVEDYTAGQTSPGRALQAVLDGLRRDGYISHGIAPTDPPSRSGHSAERISDLLTSPLMIGDAEQYAVAAALMARQIGFPSRVVVGFVPSDEHPGVILGSDISAWIEVNTAEYGWVALDPVPAVRPIPDAPPQDPTQISRPQTPVEPPPDEPDPRTTQNTPDTTQEPDAPDDAWLQVILAVLRIAGPIALLLGLLASPFLVVVAAKARRRRLRRRAREPLVRISGAWDEFRDAAIDRGFADIPASTRTEFAESVGLAQSRTLAAVADRAVFSSDVIAPAEADRMWRALRELDNALDRGLTRWQRIRARISLRSLGGYSVRRLLRGRRTRR
ncbi:transglutaminase-like domain-containing protein [Schumannella soli]|uniref:Transglutaminase domain-containing protein n=1 Tax=Schumannella soli TaxID=2590779 RepID=A0A506XTG2_9MICO|nr:transglutaminase-like domain-containing protein [Schumannella soli]TPW76001.1 transglutaminase domain-containing protein [Schumannella soli]